ncbi:MAG: ferredoxin [Chitinispirillaceae bacterium]
MRARIESHLCCGCGMCVSFCPELFGLAPSGKAIPKTFSIPFALEDECALVTQFCPRQAVKMVNCMQSDWPE